MAPNSQTIFDYFKTQQFAPDFYAEETLLPEQETMRRRKQELYALLRRVIQNELSEQDRLLIRLHWYQGKSAGEIAPLIGLSRSSVYRRLEKINETIYEKLKYALEYRFGRNISPEELQRFSCCTAPSRYDRIGSIGERLHDLRRAQLLSRAELCRVAGIDAERLRHLEQHGADMTMPELKAICKALSISADELIFGTAAAGPSPGREELLHG